MKQNLNLILQSNGCKACGEKFNDKGSFMKHMKKEHVEMVPACRAYVNDRCNRNESSCWFVHATKVVENMDVDKEAGSNEADEQVNNVGFCKATKKTPPDQKEKLMEMIMKLITKISQ